MFESIMDVFRGITTPTATSTPGPTGVNNPGESLPNTGGGNNTNSNGIIPKDGEKGPAGEKKEDPYAALDPFRKAWEIPKPDPNAPTKVSMLDKMDPKKVMESAGTVDFSKVLTPELMTKASAGGQDAITALAQAMNAVAQNVYGQSAIAMTGILKAALQEQRTQFEADLPALVRSHSVTDTVSAVHPAMADPAVQPVVQALKQMMIQQNPNATSAEISKNLNDYFSALGQVFAPQNKNKTEGGGSGSEPKKGEVYDFSKFLRVGS